MGDTENRLGDTKAHNYKLWAKNNLPAPPREQVCVNKLRRESHHEKAMTQEPAIKEHRKRRSK